MVGAGVAKVEIRVIENPTEMEGNEDHNAETGLLQHNWIIQIASFASRENADKLVERLKNNDFNPQQEFTTNGYIRIILKDISNNDLETVNNRLRGLGFSNVLLRKP
jgi:cell division septation protein DedD